MTSIKQELRVRLRKQEMKAELPQLTRAAEEHGSLATRNQ